MIQETDFECVEVPVEEPDDGQFLVRNLYFAFEPAMRGWLNDVKSYVPPVGLGEVMRASTVVLLPSPATGSVAAPLSCGQSKSTN